MEINRLPSSLLKGQFLHCQPVEDGPIIKALIVPSDDGSTLALIVVCPARRVRARCFLRASAGSGDKLCQYRRGDSFGEYQIVGPGMDNKSNEGWV